MKKPEKEMKRPFDYALFLTTILLVALGLTMVYSASGVLARERFHDSTYFLKKELIAVVVGFIGLVVAKTIPLEYYRKISYPLFGAALILLVTVLIPGIGTKAGGAQRWLKLGPFSFQPSEFAKLSMVVFLAYVLSKKQEKIQIFLVGFVPPMILSGMLVVLVLAGDDLGNAVVMASTVLVLMFIGGARLSYLLSEVLLALPAAYYLIFGVAYRKQRIMAFLDPWEHKQGAGFQIIQSYLAFHAGSLFGQGLGEGKQKLFYLPEAHTDFIFSVVGEELGLLGSLTVIALFAVWIFRAYAIAWKAPDQFSSFLALGIAVLFSFQVVFNIAVVMGLLPTKGLALPFLSYGGTAMIVGLTCVGILLNVSSRIEV
ncbi:MAG TPA: putative lipid II flippase FtsW [bacterium]|nr:putative lipid II flippase FtsW [bacterium]